MLAEIYVFIGENITSAFKGKGNLSPLKKLNRPHHQEDFQIQNKVLTLYLTELYLKLYVENFQILFFLNSFT